MLGKDSSSSLIGGYCAFITLLCLLRTVVQCVSVLFCYFYEWWVRQVCLMQLLREEYMCLSELRLSPFTFTNIHNHIPQLHIQQHTHTIRIQCIYSSIHMQCTSSHIHIQYTYTQHTHTVRLHTHKDSIHNFTHTMHIQQQSVKSKV